jgi:hypothetical protein
LCEIRGVFELVRSVSSDSEKPDYRLLDAALYAAWVSDRFFFVLIYFSMGNRDPQDATNKTPVSTEFALQVDSASI